MKIRFHMVASILGTALLAGGCASLQEAYRPQQAGNLEDGNRTGSAQVTLSTPSAKLKLGQPVHFAVHIRNIGPRSIVIPGESDIELDWIYPDGRRDMTLGDETADKYANSMVLKPGQEVVYKAVLETDYFRKPGVTEFHAVVEAREVDHVGTVLAKVNGVRAVSNGYGIAMEN